VYVGLIKNVWLNTKKKKTFATVLSFYWRVAQQRFVVQAWASVKLTVVRRPVKLKRSKQSFLPFVLSRGQYEIFSSFKTAFQGYPTGVQQVLNCIRPIQPICHILVQMCFWRTLQSI